ncbi:MAG TPA: tetratricopeptide repeat protein, partial [Bacteroidota bacterium]|nr:tetratricopeptide repeat protein [Bacteroidota bacterium]
MRKTAFIVKPFLFLFLLGFTSCGVWDFFAAYFNTYYNAKRLYDEAVEEVWIMPEVKETGRNMLILPPISQGTRVKFTSVIEKCSKLLQYHPESNLVDDALLMIGRSYYYQAEYQQAERKFNELIEGYPESNLVPETKVLQAYGYYRIQDFKKAETEATKVFEAATADEDSRTIADISLLLGQLALDAKQYTQAREYYAKVGEMGDLADKRAQALLKVAEMYIEEGDFKPAQQAYLQARGLSGSYIGEYRGLVGAARMLALQGEHDAALDALIDLRENANYREYHGEIDVEIGHVYRDQGDLESAIDQYHYVDTAYARTESAANANYALGMLYENTLHMYDSAKVAYDKGRNAPPQTKVLPQIIRRSDYLGRFLQYNGEVNRLDSTLKVAVAYADSIKRVESLRPKTQVDTSKSQSQGLLTSPDSAKMEKVPAQLAGGEPLKSPADSSRIIAGDQAVVDRALAGPDTSAASAGQAVVDRALAGPDTSVTSAGQAAELASKLPDAAAPATPGDPARSPAEGVAPPPASGEPKVLTGRAARTRGRVARETDGSPRDVSPGEAETTSPVIRSDSLTPQVPPQPPQHPDTVRKRLAGAIDNLAGVLYISMGKPDSAGFLYRRLLNEFPESPVAPRALYVLARIEGEDSATAPTVTDSLYRLLIEKYPTSMFADEARRLVGIPPVQNISDLAEGSYARGADLLKIGETRAAIDTFTTLASAFPQSPAASRALYAAGWTYENQTPLRDSAAAVYERLVSRYPGTTYAQKVQPVVKEVQIARQQALE